MPKLRAQLLLRSCLCARTAFRYTTVNTTLEKIAGVSVVSVEAHKGRTQPVEGRSESTGGAATLRLSLQSSGHSLVIYLDLVAPVSIDNGNDKSDEPLFHNGGQFTAARLLSAEASFLLLNQSG